MRDTDLKALLTWTYRDELTKRAGIGYGDGFGAVAAYAQRGGVSVSFSMTGPNLGAPHPDAELVAASVQQLAPVQLMRPGAPAEAEAKALMRHFVGPMAAAITGEGFASIARRVAAPMDIRPEIQSLALGVRKPPVREAWGLRALDIDARTGKPVALDVRWRTERVGLGAGRGVFRRVMVSGHSRIGFTPDPAGVVLERLRWAAIVEACEALEATLRGRLASWRLTGTGLAVEPWRADLHRGALVRVLADVGGPGAVGRAPTHVSLDKIGLTGGRTRRGRPLKRAVRAG